MSVITDRFARARQMSRALFPAWSRKARARWVLAKLRAGEPRVPISTCHDVDPTTPRFLRRA